MAFSSNVTFLFVWSSAASTRSVCLPWEGEAVGTSMSHDLSSSFNLFFPFSVFFPNPNPPQQLSPDIFRLFRIIWAFPVEPC